jgi:hypothetical protein
MKNESVKVEDKKRLDRKGEKEEMGGWRGKREDGGESRDGDEGEM